MPFPPAGETALVKESKRVPEKLKFWMKKSRDKPGNPNRTVSERQGLVNAATSRIGLPAPRRRAARLCAQSLRGRRLGERISARPCAYYGLPQPLHEQAAGFGQIRRQLCAWATSGGRIRKRRFGQNTTAAWATEDGISQQQPLHQAAGFVLPTAVDGVLGQPMGMGSLWAWAQPYFWPTTTAADDSFEPQYSHERVLAEREVTTKFSLPSCRSSSGKGSSAMPTNALKLECRQRWTAPRYANILSLWATCEPAARV